MTDPEDRARDGAMDRASDQAATRARIGRLGLHGGGEFRGDDAFLGALLRTAAGARRDRSADTPLRVVLLPTAAARERPALAAAGGIAAFEQVALDLSLPIAPSEARVIDARTAADDGLAWRLESADLVYLPGGDPGVVLDVLADSAAWHAVSRARMRGAVVAGASAGAMALGELTWTPDGIRRGFGWAGRVFIVPHADRQRAGADLAADARERRRALGREDLALFLLEERTGVIGDGTQWSVAGAGEVHVLAPHATALASYLHGASFNG
jgi:hypothetical protein